MDHDKATKDRELERLKFVEDRDGKEAMLKFAEQGLAIYITDSIKHSKYKASIDTYTKVLEDNGYKVLILCVGK